MAFNKEEYWKNRQEGKRGQGVDVTVAPAPVVPDTATIGFTEDGHLTIKNRAFRRTNTRISPESSQLRKKGKRKKK